MTIKTLPLPELERLSTPDLRTERNLASVMAGVSDAVAARDWTAYMRNIDTLLLRRFNKLMVKPAAIES